MSDSILKVHAPGTDWRGVTDLSALSGQVAYLGKQLAAAFKEIERLKEALALSTADKKTDTKQEE